jgi:hypothetical protein
VKRAGAWRVSQIKEDFCVIAASYGCSIKEERTAYYVRGVRVCPVHIPQVIDKQGRTYGWYIWPDYRRMLVNEGNVRERKVSRYGSNSIQPTMGAEQLRKEESSEPQVL